MAKVVVWSERDEAVGKGWHDCTYSSALMALVYGGFTKFPLGIYTAAEREALERSDNQPDETGASQVDITVAVKRRYGVSLRTVPEPLAVALTKVGRAITLAGSNGNLPKGHALRRWDPGFTGGHSITVVTLGGGKVLWLDPEAPWKHSGDVVPIQIVLKWAWGGISNMRYILENEFATGPVHVPVPLPPVPVPPIPVPPADQGAALEAALASLAAAKTSLAALELKVSVLRQAMADLGL